MLLSEVVKNLDKKLFNPIIVLNQKKDTYRLYKDKAIMVKVLPGAGYARNLTKLLKMSKIDIVVTNTPHILSGAFSAKILHIPHIWYIHSDIEDVYPLLSHKMAKKILSVIWMLSSKIMTVSYATRRQFDFITEKSNKLVTIHNGVDVDYFALKKKRGLLPKYGIKKSDLVVSMFSRLDPLKRHRDFIKAAREVKRSVRNVKFIISGEDSSPNYKRELISLIKKNGLDSSFIFTGYLKDISPLLSMTDIVVLPSVTEGLPLTLLEAMAAGKSIVAADIPAHREAVTHKKTGLLVKSEDPLSLGRAVLYLLCRPQMRKTMGRRGRRRVKKFFNILNTVLQLESLCETAIKDGQK